jgi:hypothetical protein
MRAALGGLLSSVGLQVRHLSLDGSIVARLSRKYLPSEENKAESINSDNQDRNAREARLRPLLRRDSVPGVWRTPRHIRERATASSGAQRGWRPTGSHGHRARTLENIETVPLAVRLCPSRP